jgi:hypothetical protein
MQFPYDSHEESNDEQDRCDLGNSKDVVLKDLLRKLMVLARLLYRRTFQCRVVRAWNKQPKASNE